MATVNKRMRVKKNVPLATTMFYDYNRYEVIGIATSITVHAVSAFRGIGANIGALFGGKSGLLEKVFYDARKEAYEELSKKASLSGSDLVIGVTIDVQEMNKFFIFTAAGTMLKKKKK